MEGLVPSLKPGLHDLRFASGRFSSLNSDVGGSDYLGGLV